jgi:hypothetical protein
VNDGAADQRSLSFLRASVKEKREHTHTLVQRKLMGNKERNRRMPRHSTSLRCELAGEIRASDRMHLGLTRMWVMCVIGYLRYEWGWVSVKRPPFSQAVPEENPNK